MAVDRKQQATILSFLSFLLTFVSKSWSGQTFNYHLTVVSTTADLALGELLGRDKLGSTFFTLKEDCRYLRCSIVFLPSSARSGSSAGDHVATAAAAVLSV